MKQFDSWENLEFNKDFKKKSMEELFINEEIINTESDSESNKESEFIDYSDHEYKNNDENGENDENNNNNRRCEL